MRAEKRIGRDLSVFHVSALVGRGVLVYYTSFMRKRPDQSPRPHRYIDVWVPYEENGTPRGNGAA